MSSSCSHLSMVRIPPATGTPIHREECTQCFHSDYTADGLDVCLTCWNGGCPTKHSKRHATITGHGVVVNIKKVDIDIPADTSEPASKISKLAIGLPGGVQVSDQPTFTYDTKVRCLLCTGDIDATQEQVVKAVNAILEAKSSSQPTEVGWEEVKEPCQHTKNLVQQDGIKILTKALSTCGSCSINESLWICLTCGGLGCSRPVYGGGGGNGHAVAHYESTKHPLVLKAGTITPEGTADIYCYACDKDVVDPHLIQHLGHFGINVENEQQTVKSTAELELEMNLNKNWSTVTEADGKEAELLFGPGMTGLTNLGNSCYMASVLQVLYNLDMIRNKYHTAGTKHLEECRQWRPADCYQCQMAKLADGLWSGRYAPQPTQEEWDAHKASIQKEKEARAAATASTAMTDIDENKEISKKRKKPLQSGIPPRMFKSLITKNHNDFSGPKQQDAYDFWQYLVGKIQQSEKSSGVDPTEIFQFVMENRLECTECHGVRYTTTRTSEIQLPIPHTDEIKSASSLPEPVAPAAGASEEEQKKYQRELARYREQAKTIAPVPFTDCIKEWAATTHSDNWNCPKCAKPVKAAQSVRMRTFPEVLVVQMRRFVFDQWVPRKLDVDIILDEEVSFDSVRATGLQSNEHELPSASAGGAAPVKVANEAIVSQLLSMGFTKEACTRAALAVDNASADAASNWLFGHLEDPDINDPLPTSTPAAAPKANTPPEDAIIQLESMGFPRDRCIYALTQTSNDPNRAIDWLFSHMDDPIPAPGAAATPAKAPVIPLDTAPAGYNLIGFIEHQGKFTSSGHYIAFIKKNDKWVKFNDEKVSLSTAPPKQHGYLYFFTRARSS